MRLSEIKVWTDIVRGTDWQLGAAVDATYEEILNRPLPGNVHLAEKIKQECSGLMTEEGLMSCIVPMLDLYAGAPFQGTNKTNIVARKTFLAVFKKHARIFIEESAKGVL